MQAGWGWAPLVGVGAVVLRSLTYVLFGYIILQAIAYSAISPIINGLSAVTFFLFYVLWKYRLLWQPASCEQVRWKASSSPNAMQHVFIRLYMEGICLMALFFLAQDRNKQSSAIPEGALTMMLTAFTAFFHVIINNSYGPLIDCFLLTLTNHDRYNESVMSAVEPIQVEKQQNPNMKMHVRPGPESCSLIDSKGKAQNTEDIERDYNDDDVRQSDKDNAVVRKSILSLDEEVDPKDFYHPASVEP
ncbi:uncharacterized protein LAESUDRAFT_789654 [Laetiporus sulphureus 93-53]|uniref:CSC1/OSCA1-like 7TM region domain-containing protein n=1 Tax=Laetiporus sulphureus 93-53 TaxID=1314785 RepID=A0A165CSE7_9APHY|nr:uncharacterized protein LAESUDRAFT_789654 [Laetiporus sulphureus 93-53]KZT03355.1 hypothetical protein LAESUDRAFT_789654 [Laetiporus sulphureus 93-53]